MKLRDIISYIIIIVAVILIRTFLVTPIKVNGDSMNNTLYNGELMFLKKYAASNIKRFDIVVLQYKDEKIIKRVIGMPKEEIEYKDNVLYINGSLIEEKYGLGNTKDFKDYCGDSEYYVMGDNRGNSLDSRIFGCVKKDKILGTTDFVFFPFSKIGKVE